MPDILFNLLDEKWIRVLHGDGSQGECSLREIFVKAHEIKALAGELPTQDIAILRLLLAVLHSVFGRYDVDGSSAPLNEDEAEPEDALDRWQKLWELGHFPAEMIVSYLEQYRDRFWLFHPKAPFYQVPEMAKCTKYTASKLNGELLESNNKVRIFSQRTGAHKSVLTFAEAARWLVHTNAFDDTSGKPTRDPNRVKGLPSPGASWLGKLGLVYASAETLYETMLLNFVMLPNGEDKLWAEESPIWERPCRIAERTEINLPMSASELLTLQSRRIRLFRTKEHVTGYGLLGGDFFPRENAFSEQMTLWRLSSEKSATPTYIPACHKPQQRLWQNFSMFFSQAGAIRRPGIINWLSRLRNEGLLTIPIINIQTPSAKYADKDSFVEDISSDAIAIRSHFLGKLGEAWIVRIIEEINDSELLIQTIYSLARNIALAAGEFDGKSKAGAAAQQGYFRLDIPFRRWLASIDPEKDEMSAKSEEWWVTEQKIIRDLGKELIEKSGLQSFTGRSESDKNPNPITAPQAYNFFLSRTKSRQNLRKGAEKWKKK